MVLYLLVSVNSLCVGCGTKVEVTLPLHYLNRWNWIQYTSEIPNSTDVAFCSSHYVNLIMSFLISFSQYIYIAECSLKCKNVFKKIVIAMSRKKKEEKKKENTKPNNHKSGRNNYGLI